MANFGTNQFASSLTPADLSEAASDVRGRLDGLVSADGYWEGHLSSSALSTATAISAFSFYLTDADADEIHDVLREQIAAGIAWLGDQQNEDGGWGDTRKNYSNISTTMLVVAALHAARRQADFPEAIARAEKYIAEQGGIEGLRKRYGKDKTFAVPILANCALAGIVPWREVSALPFEAACVPQRFYNWLQLPVVSYAIPALVAIGQAKFHFDPPWDPIRKTVRRLSIQPGLRVLEKMQPASGGYLEAIPLTSFVCMALIRCGRASHPVVQNGIRFLLDSFRDEEEPQSASQVVAKGSWPIDTNLATWNTTLTINAFAGSPARFRETLNENADRWKSCLEWLLECQNVTVHPFTGAEPGGWGWSNLSGAVPDADDTPGALLALRAIVDAEPDWLDDGFRQRIEDAVSLGVGWLLGLQNRDGGWPTFCRGWGKLPFDRSGADITAHAIRGLLAWCDDGVEEHALQFENVAGAVERGFRYLKNQQRPDGSWLPLWFGNQDQADEENPCYGTAKVLMAYRDAKKFDTFSAKRGFSWLASYQSDRGGWGGGASLPTCSDQWDVSQLGTSSVEETALCAEVMLSSPETAHQKNATAGLNWLVRAVGQQCIDVPSPIGFYFAKLWYFEKLYPLIFSAAAFERATERD